MLLGGSGGDHSFPIQRLHADGSLDTSFADQGRAFVKFSGATDYDEPASIALLAKDSIVAAGYASLAYGASAASKDFAVVQLLANGSPDPRFGDGQGRSTYPLSVATDQAFAVAASSDGDLLVAGTANDDQFQGTGAS